MRLSQRVSPGSFTITEVPVITGEGEVRLLVRDILGRENLISVPYYASSDLLQAGLHDYTYEAGFLRRRFAIESNDYGRFFIAGTHRLGLNDRLTGELRAELMAEQQTAGAAVTYNWRDVGIVNGAAALSHGPRGQGGLLSVGLQHQGQTFGFSLHTQLASDRFTQLGESERFVAPRQVTLARANLSTGSRGSAFLSYVHQAGPTQPDIDLVSAGYSVNLFGNTFLSLFAVHSLDDRQAASFGLNLTHAFGSRTTGSINWSRQDGRSTPSIQLQQSLPHGDGFGYRLASTGGPYPRQSAALLMQNGVGSYSVEASRENDMSAQRFSAAGGVALLGGGLHLSRRLDDSFAVVKVGDFPNVPVSADNQVVAHTDANGSALVPALRAYQKNSISIHTDALPLDAEIDAVRLSITPRRRSGSLVAFPVRSVRGALLKIFLADGTPLPSGAVVTVNGQEGSFPVARRGEAYVTGLARDNVVRAAWKGRDCTLQVALPADPGPLPVLGPFVCHGVTP
ncbi:fimbria/pilus outer membrane usher protein [Sedimenticola hydrogenitrophicus]|uniref:fimbria/pilus outer membrane usher protein n=1 Tax=Sedimenticola hydrogenitrophicus TaxID=2967975 RepID=UPI0021A6B78E|nr:fimbria/pilus outer membrane usher protein [Sedimenticola hydrogenitrophicus]